MLKNWQQDIDLVKTLSDLDNLRVQLLGKNGVVTQQLKSLGSLNPDERKSKGAEINKLKQDIHLAIDLKKNQMEKIALQHKLASESVDISLPVNNFNIGKIHPITKVIEEIQDYFGRLGFQTFYGPDIETVENNFDALNIPAHHPARQSHDTFYVNHPGHVLRTHTSNVEVHVYKNQPLPLRFLSVGRTYRSDYDATHTPMFHQMEVVAVEEGLDFRHLKGMLIDFCRWFFDDKNLKLRFRPSYFPFTEPSAEVDIGWKDGKWLEVLGCGVIHPNVLSSCGIDPDKHQALAFGMGVERFAMLKYGLNDLRAFFDNDSRWLQHWGF